MPLGKGFSSMKHMIKLSIHGRIAPLSALVMALLFSDAAIGSPSQSAEIETLKQQVLDLQKRVERLEGEIEQGVPVNPARVVEPEPGGWRTAGNWNLLAKGMPYYEVIRILGEPDSTKTVRKFEYWYYGDGKLRLYLRRLKSWEVPAVK